MTLFQAKTWHAVINKNNIFSWMFWTSFTVTATAGSQVQSRKTQINQKKGQEIMRNQFVSADHIARVSFSFSSSTCPWPLICAGPSTTVAMETPSDPTSWGRAAVGGVCWFTWSCCCCLFGRRSPATSSWRPTASCPSSCLLSARGL